ncbi:MAG: ATP-binding protein, partial [Candidatus Dadabacteria bacterium]|nr:ATP-binding protein [Candidatus Dadabacteria bacterium]
SGRTADVTLPGMEIGIGGTRRTADTAGTGSMHPKRSHEPMSIYCVEDNGIGIPREHHTTVFQIFNRLDPQASSGEGLGLAIVKKILDRHGGDVWLESEPGSGTKFFVALPAPLHR